MMTDLFDTVYSEKDRNLAVKIRLVEQAASRGR